MMDSGKLWRKRAGSFWRHILPYFQYVVSSGLALFLFVLLIVTLHYYAKLLEHLSESLPVNWMAVAFLLPVIAFNPIRTFFKQADIIFVLPAEHHLKAYLTQAMLVSLIVQSVFTAVVWLAVWPLYRVSAGVGTSMFVLILVVLLVMKWTSLFAYWQEQQLLHAVHRNRYVAVRWVLTGALLYLLFTFSPAHVMIVVALVLMTYMIALRLPAKHFLNWEHLIAIEERQHAKYYAFLSWFIDTPQFQGKVSVRRYLNGVSKLLSFNQANAYRYLYLKTFIRTDVFSIVLRLTVIGFVIIYLLQHDIFKGILFVLFGYMIGVQLQALGQHHRYSFWLEVYPLPREALMKGLISIIRSVHVMVILLLYLAVLLSTGNGLHALYILLAGVGLFGIFYMRQKKMRKRVL